MRALEVAYLRIKRRIGSKRANSIGRRRAAGFASHCILALKAQKIRQSSEVQANADHLEDARKLRERLGQVEQGSDDEKSILFALTSSLASALPRANKSEKAKLLIWLSDAWFLIATRFGLPFIGESRSSLTEASKLQTAELQGKIECRLALISAYLSISNPKEIEKPIQQFKQFNYGESSPKSKSLRLFGG
jgi:hypothetical protein